MPSKCRKPNYIQVDINISYSSINDEQHLRIVAL